MMKKRHVAAVLCCATMLSCAVAVSASAASPSEEADDTPMAGIIIESGGSVVSTVDAATLSADTEEVIIEGEVGEHYVVGDLIFEIVSKEEISDANSDTQARASAKRWSVDLSGDSMSQAFEVTSSYPYAKVWVDNDGSSSIKFTITKNSPTGSVVSGSSITIPAGTSVSVYSSKAWPAATYYANFTSGKADMVGTAACRVASTLDELDI